MSLQNDSPEREPARSSSSQDMLCVLAGFSVGLFAQQMQQPSLAIAATAVSVLSLGVLLGARVVARWRRIVLRRRNSRRAVKNLENRLHRHVAGIPRPHIRRPLRHPGMERQYLSVVTRGSRGTR